LDFFLYKLEPEQLIIYTWHVGKYGCNWYDQVFLISYSDMDNAFVNQTKYLYFSANTNAYCYESEGTNYTTCN
jgi:hypothetical protein